MGCVSSSPQRTVGSGQSVAGRSENNGNLHSKSTSANQPNIFTVVLTSGKKPMTAKLEVTDGYVIMHRKRREPMKWPLAYLRRYGYENGIFSFESGRRCESGPGVFTFKCSKAETLFLLVQKNIQENAQETLNLRFPTTAAALSSRATTPKPQLNATISSFGGNSNRRSGSLTFISNGYHSRSNSLSSPFRLVNNNPPMAARTGSQNSMTLRSIGEPGGIGHAKQIRPHSRNRSSYPPALDCIAAEGHLSPVIIQRPCSPSPIPPNIPYIPRSASNTPRVSMDLSAMPNMMVTPVKQTLSDPINANFTAATRPLPAYDSHDYHLSVCLPGGPPENIQAPPINPVTRQMPGEMFQRKPASGSPISPASTTSSHVSTEVFLLDRQPEPIHTQPSQTKVTKGQVAQMPLCQQQWELGVAHLRTKVPHHYVNIGPHVSTANSSPRNTVSGPTAPPAYHRLSSESSGSPSNMTRGAPESWRPSPAPRLTVHSRSQSSTANDLLQQQLFSTSTNHRKLSTASNSSRCSGYSGQSSASSHVSGLSTNPRLRELFADGRNSAYFNYAVNHHRLSSASDASSEALMTRSLIISNNNSSETLILPGTPPTGGIGSMSKDKLAFFASNSAQANSGTGGRYRPEYYYTMRSNYEKQQQQPASAQQLEYITINLVDKQQSSANSGSNKTSETRTTVGTTNKGANNIKGAADTNSMLSGHGGGKLVRKRSASTTEFTSINNNSNSTFTSCAPTKSPNYSPLQRPGNITGDRQNSAATSAQQSAPVSAAGNLNYTVIDMQRTKALKNSGANFRTATPPHLSLLAAPGGTGSSGGNSSSSPSEEPRKLRHNSAIISTTC